MNYLVVLPALRLFPSAMERPPRRNALMIAAHVAWGAVFGWSVQWLTDS